ncbi:MAG: hypothetical protein HYX49_14000 [Chloroflexi bacterium]|nr:hypothetical protein [Chloroflexota bacterium]
MKKHGYFYLIGFAIMVIIVGLACSGGTTVPAAQSTQPPQQPAPTQAVSSPGNSNNNSAPTGNSSAPVSFTDKNNFYQIDVPGDWKQSSESGTNYYIDQFKSPDGNALVENIAYDDGTAFSGSQNGQFALQLLHQFYSNTGKEGDIRVSEDKIMQDGSERLTWTSKGGGYSGASYFEVRKKTTFLMLTIEWSNDYESTYLDTLNAVVTSYRLP